MTSHYLKQLSTFIEMLNFKTINPQTIEKAKLVIADCLAAIIGGQAEDEMIALCEKFNKSDQSGSSIIGTSMKLSPMEAALINGSSGTFLEMDEGNQFAKGHPAMHVLPALLAHAESSDIDGEAFLTAFIIAYEVAARLGIATQLRHSMHPHGTWGVVGGIVGLTKHMGYDANTIKRGINIASSLSLATSRKTMLEGGTVRNVYTGISNQMALTALTLLDTGFDGEHDGLSSVFGQVVSDTFNSSAMIDNLGKTWEIDRNYFKLHACCRFNHASLDALLHIVHHYGNDFEINDIYKIEINTYHLAAELSDPCPRNSLAARFSIPFAIATTLINGTSDITSFSGNALSNEDTLALARLVNVNEDPELSSMLPEKRPSTVCIKLRNGRELIHGVETNRGDWQDPYSQEELKVKYHSLCSRCWSFEQSAYIYDEIMNLDKSLSIRTLMKTISQASG